MSKKFNETLDNFGKKINSVAASAKEKTVRLAKATQIRIDIKSAEASLDVVYEDIGKAYYASLKGEEYTGEAIEDLIARAESIKEKIKALKESLKEYSE
ncbi:MAG: hypothetical protein IJ400_02490 [Clostridia bacterium]|nr:hypothetical protein [Clostridia bacterium]